MYGEAKKARQAMKNKAKRLASEKSERVDSSTWTQAEPLDADVKTGMRPVSRRAYRSGGKVQGEVAKKNVGKKARASGGAANAKQIALAKVNRNVKDANEEREGKKHIGGMKTGGRAKKKIGGAAADILGVLSPVVMAANMMRGDKDEKKHGGRTKKKIGGGTPLPPEMPEDVKQARARALAESMVDAQKRKDGRTLPQDPTKQLPGDYATNAGGYADQNRKRGGRTKKMDGGPMGDPRLNIAKSQAFDLTNTKGAPGTIVAKRGGKISHMEWEHSKKDLAEDKKLAKKHGMSMEKWEKSKLDEKHDKQQSTKGLKKGGRAGRATGGMINETKKLAALKADPHNQTKIKPAMPAPKEPVAEKCGGGRMARKAGGRAKGKTNINIVIATGKGQPGQDGMPMMPPGGPMGGPKPGGVPVPMPAGGPPSGAPQAMPIPMPMPAPQQPPMARKAGGRITKVAKSYKDMEAGSGSGEGRLQKTDIAKRDRKDEYQKGEKAFTGLGYPNKVPGATGGRTARKAGGKAYRSYKDMDAGAGSGEGRLEKTEIAKRKK